jgi:hypothetical protein
MPRRRLALLLVLLAALAACGGDDEDGDADAAAAPAAEDAPVVLDEPIIGDAEPMTWDGALANPIAYCTAVFDVVSASSADEYEIHADGTNALDDVFCSATNVTREVDFLFRVALDEGEWASRTWEWESVEDVTVAGADAAKWIVHGGDQWLDVLAGNLTFTVDPTGGGDARDLTIAVADGAMAMLPLEV